MKFGWRTPFICMHAYMWLSMYVHSFTTEADIFMDLSYIGAKSVLSLDGWNAVDSPAATSGPAVCGSCRLGVEDQEAVVTAQVCEQEKQVRWGWFVTQLSMWEKWQALPVTWVVTHYERKHSCSHMSSESHVGKRRQRRPTVCSFLHQDQQVKPLQHCKTNTLWYWGHFCARSVVSWRFLFFTFLWKIGWRADVSMKRCAATTMAAVCVEDFWAI